MEDQQHLHINM